MRCPRCRQEVAQLYTVAGHDGKGCADCWVSLGHHRGLLRSIHRTGLPGRSAVRRLPSPGRRKMRRVRAGLLCPALVAALSHTTNGGISMNQDSKFYTQISQCRCPNEACDSVIHNEFIAANQDPITGIRTIKAYCRHCDKLWMGTFRPVNGFYLVEKQAHEITDSRLKSAFKRRLDLALGSVQRKDLPPVKCA